jgi:hypothetical protein
LLEAELKAQTDHVELEPLAHLGLFAFLDGSGDLSRLGHDQTGGSAMTEWLDWKFMARNR